MDELCVYNCLFCLGRQFISTSLKSKFGLWNVALLCDLFFSVSLCYTQIILILFLILKPACECVSCYITEHSFVCTLLI